jgi:hypothetical protein
MHLAIPGAVKKMPSPLGLRKAFMQSKRLVFSPRVPNSNNPAELGTPQVGAQV